MKLPAGWVAARAGTVPQWGNLIESERNILDINMMVWASGTCCALAVFAFKAGIGLRHGMIRAGWMALILAGYLGLFTVMALLVKVLPHVPGPPAGKGPYLHLALAAGMILWGLYFIVWRTKRKNTRKPEERRLKTSSAIPILPCPFCLGAMLFSIRAGVAVTGMSPLFLGFCLGGAFILMALAAYYLVRNDDEGEAPTTLGFAAMVVGFYFILAPIIPAKVEEVKNMYSSFLAENQAMDMYNTLGTCGILLLMMAAGYFAGRQRKEMEP